MQKSFSWIKRTRTKPHIWVWGMVAAVLTSVLVDVGLVRHRIFEAWQARRGAVPGSLLLPSEKCGSCHEEIYAAWAGSHHAHAHRSVDTVADADAFYPPRHLTVEGVGYDVSWRDGKPAFMERRAGHPDDHYTADYVLAYRPLRQYIVPVGNLEMEAIGLIRSVN